MSSRRQWLRQRRSLDEIGKIMHSMKLLAQMEEHRLGALRQHQHAHFESVLGIAAEFFRHYPGAWPELSDGPDLCIVVGSERGFCGDFNHRLLHRMQALRDTQTQCLIVGSKLFQAAGSEVGRLLPGGSVAEELPAVRDALATEIAALPGIGRLQVLYHDAEPGQIQLRTLLPPFEAQATSPSTAGIAPLLNLSTSLTLERILEHYALAVLNEVLGASLLAENRQRARHLEQADHHLQERQLRIDRRISALRREEIIEEIEVILLSVDAAQAPPAPR